eukprot:s131_g23.t1
MLETYWNGLASSTSYEWITCRWILLAMVAICRGCEVLTEQPSSSLMLEFPYMKWLAVMISPISWSLVRFQMAAYGHANSKPTVLFGTSPYTQKFKKKPTARDKRRVQKNKLIKEYQMVKKTINKETGKVQVTGSKGMKASAAYPRGFAKALIRYHKDHMAHGSYKRPVVQSSGTPPKAPHRWRHALLADLRNHVKRAASDASTVHYPDAMAIANAKKGCEAQKKHDAMLAAQRGPATPCANTRPPLVRVNSVPVLTPPNRIRRRSTPTPVAEPVVENNTEHAEPELEETANGDEVVDPGNGDTDTTPETQTKKKKTKNKRLRRKLQKQQSLQEQDQTEMTTEEIQTNAAQQQGSDTTAPAQPDTAVQPAQEAAPSEAIPNPNGQVPETPAVAPKRKLAARKAAAKAPSTVKAEPLERQNTEQELHAAQAANLQRSNTAAQQTPSPTPARSNPANAPVQMAAPVVPNPGTADATEPQSDDLETKLDREIKKETPGTTAPAPQSNDKEDQDASQTQTVKRIRKDCPKEMKKAYHNAAYCTAKLQLLQDAWVECEGWEIPAGALAGGQGN